MATKNQLRARVRPTHADHIGAIAETENIKETEAERKVIEEGLAALGYIDRPKDGPELFLWYIRRIGVILGFTGLITMGYGVFGTRLFSIVGFSLLLAGFLFVALEEGIQAFAPPRGRTDK